MFYKPAYSPVGLSPPVFVGIAPANPSAANPANGFLAKPLIYGINKQKKKQNKKIVNNQRKFFFF